LRGDVREWKAGEAEDGMERGEDGKWILPPQLINFNHCNQLLFIGFDNQQANTFV